MEGVLNLKDGDYRVWLDMKEVVLLQNNGVISGVLAYRNGGVSQTHRLILVMKPKEEIRKLKVTLRAEGRYFYEGPHVMVEVVDGIHTVSYIQEEIDDLTTKLNAHNPFGHYANRYDSFTGRKIFLYLQTQQG